MPKPGSLEDYFTVAGNFDLSWRATQFYNHQDTLLAEMDSRLELWPTGRQSFTWGPYLRIAGNASDRSDRFFENVWLAEPGSGGLQCYPFRFDYFREPGNLVGEIFGALRLFGEYNIVHYRGSEDFWRPNRNIRAGIEEYVQRYVNDTHKPYWFEVYGGLIWQSTQEFNATAVIFSQSVRAGVRLPNAGIVSCFTPYLAIENSLADHPDEFYNNALMLGAGVRFAPDLSTLPPEWRFLNRFFLYAEYDIAARYWDRDAPSRAIPGNGVTPFTPATPSYDWQVGIQFSIGDFWH